MNGKNLRGSSSVSLLVFVIFQPVKRMKGYLGKQYNDRDASRPNRTLGKLSHQKVQ